MRNLFISFAVACLCCACSSSDNPIEAQGGTFSPVFTGLRVTASAGPKQIAVWGNPLSPDASPPSRPSTPGVIGDDPTGFGLYNPYPNPSSGTMNFSWRIERSDPVHIWISPVRLQGSAPDAEMIGGATLNASNLVVVRELANNQLLAGEYTLVWDGTDNSGKPVPAGFYRIYLMAGGKLSWHDFMIFRSRGDMPASLANLTAD